MADHILNVGQRVWSERYHEFLMLKAKADIPPETEAWAKRYEEFLKKQAEAHIPPAARPKWKNGVNWADRVWIDPESEAAPEPTRKRNLVDWYGD